MSERKNNKNYPQTVSIEEVSEVLQECYKDAQDFLKSKTRKLSSEHRTSAVKKTARCPKRRICKLNSRNKAKQMEALSADLKRDMEREIHSTYYKEGGFRFSACNFSSYVKVNLPYEDDFYSMWVAGYNTCLNPMAYIQKKLEEKLEALQAESDVEPPELENSDLRVLMAEFSERIHEDRLDSQDNWEPEAYRQALQSYCEDLNQRLLEPYQLQEDQ